MAKTFMDSVRNAQERVPSISPEELHDVWQDDPDMMVLDVRDEKDIRETYTLPGAAMISLGSLSYKADETLPKEFWDERLVNHKKKPVVVTCYMGPLGSLGALELQEMGYDDVKYLEGGAHGWKEAGYEVAVFESE